MTHFLLVLQHKLYNFCPTDCTNPSPYPLYMWSNPICGDHFSKQNGQKNVTYMDAFSRSVDLSLLKSLSPMVAKRG